MSNPQSYDDFVRYLEKKNMQKRIDLLAKKYRGKKIIIYGAGLFSSVIFDKYDLSGLNIIGISDVKFTEEKQKFKGYDAIYPADISDYNPDLILIATYYYFNVATALFENLQNMHLKTEIKVFTKDSFFEKVKKLYLELTRK